MIISDEYFPCIATHITQVDERAPIDFEIMISVIQISDAYGMNADSYKSARNTLTLVLFLCG